MIDADKLLNKLLERKSEFERTHEKVFLPEKEAKFKALLHQLQLESDEDEEICVSYEGNSAVVDLFSEEFFSFDEVPTLRKLISISNCFTCNIVNNRPHIKLTCQFWEWVDKEQ